MPSKKASGISDLAPYPELVKLAEYDGIAGLDMYIVEDYGTTGLICRLDRTEDGRRIIIGDWRGEKWSPTHPIMNAFMQRYLRQLIEVANALKLVSAQFYFACRDNDFVLVDILIGPDKFISPGTLIELFGKILRVQDVIDRAVLNGELIDLIKSGVGRFAGDLVLKPNRYRTLNVDGKVLPLYVRVAR